MSSMAQHSPAIKAKRENKTNEMVVIATRLFNLKGLTATTMDEVAAAMDVVPGALYHYVKDKADLAYRCFSNSCERRAAHIAKADEEGLPGMEKIRRFFRNALAPGQSRMMIYSELGVLRKPQREEIKQQIKDNIASITILIRQGQTDGSIRALDPGITALALCSILDWIPLWFSYKGHYSQYDVATAFEDLLVNGIAHRSMTAFYLPPYDKFLPTMQTDEKQRRKNSFLSCAIRNFNKEGVMGTSVNQIAKQLGVTRGAIYYYVEDKEDLLFLCYQRLADFISTHASPIIGNNLLEREVLVRRVIYEGHNSSDGPIMSYAGMSSLGEKHKPILNEHFNSIMDDDQNNIASAIDQGIFRDVNPFIAEKYRGGLTNWFPCWFNPEGAHSALEIADNYSSLYLYGLAPR